MKKEKIIITGSKGTIGSILVNGLKEYQITSLDLPDYDVKDYKRLVGMFSGHKAVIHLAWDTKIENWKSGKINPDNILMAYNIYEAARVSEVPRLIMASSVHADEFIGWENPELLSPSKTPIPTSPYGASKIFVEALGRHYAKNHKLEIVCIRFGGINLDDTIIPESEERNYDKVWLSHKDCLSLIRRCLEIEEIPDILLFYMVFPTTKDEYTIFLILSAGRLRIVHNQ